METISSFWNFNLFSTSSGLTISVGHIILTVALVIAGYLLSRLIEQMLARRLESTQLKPDAVTVIRRTSFYILFTVIALTILGLLGIPITAFAFATGAIAIGIGFGAQNIINNFISGWILMAERPIRIDDFIEIEGVFGVVKRVGTRSTLIHRSDGVHLLVPNSKLLENTLVNWTLIDGLIRTQVRVGVAYGSDVELVLELMKNCVVSRPEVLREPKPEFIFEDFGDSALIFDAYFWCDVAGERSLRWIRSEVRLHIIQSFRDAGVVIAFPQRDLHIHAEHPVPVKFHNE